MQILFKTYHRKLCTGVLSLAMMLGLLCSFSIKARAYDLSIEHIQQAMYERFQEYVGTTWTNDNSYISKSGWGGRGCVGFAWVLSDAAFDDLPVLKIDYDYTHVRVGDIVRTRWDNHSVIVVDVFEDYTIRVAEGNVGNSVSWGAIYDLKGDDFNYILTRWPADYPYSYTPMKWIDNCSIPEIPDQTYTGSAVCPKLTITDGDTVLTENVDYTLEYCSRIDVGSSYVLITGKGRYGGRTIRNFEITRRELTANMVANIPDYTYTGKAITPFISIKAGSSILKKGTDYGCTITNNINVGTATVYIYPMGNNTGTRIEKTFRIIADPTPTADISYRTYVQTYGWTDWVKDKSLSGTYAQAKRMESMQIKLSKKDCAGGVTYRTYVQKDGWKPWVNDGTLSGTKGESKRVEAVQIKLYGAMSQKYDLYYQVYSQTFGWLGWAKNGGSSGTAGLSKRLEAVRIALVNKGGKAPGKTTGAFIKG